MPPNNNGKSTVDSEVVDLMSDDDEREKENGALNAAAKPSGAKRKLEARKKEGLETRSSPGEKKKKFLSRRGDDEEDEKNSEKASGARDDGDDDEIEFLKTVGPTAATATTTVTGITASSSISSATGSSKKTYAAVAKPPATIYLNDDPAIITYNLLPPMQKLQQQTSKKPRSFLLTNSTLLQHIQQTDGWSCGFRNTQMILSALVPLLPSSHPFFDAVASIYAQVPEEVYSCLGTSTDLLVLPSLDQLQREYENSWQQGFDPDGAKHFNHNMVGRQSRIGAVEVGFLFAFWRLDAHVVQFIKCVESRRLLPAFVFSYFQTEPEPEESTASVARKCVNWAEENWNATRNKTALEIFGIAATKRFDMTILPLYCQWEGHSVTVVGIEPPPGNAATHRTNDWNQWSLLILCPNNNGMKFKNSNGGTSAFRLSCRTLGRMDCQLVVSGWNPLTDEQRLERKQKSASTSAAKEAIDRLAQET